MRVLPPPSTREGMTSPHYRPMQHVGGNPFALAIWLGVWTPGGSFKDGWRVCVGRLWEEVG